MQQVVTPFQGVPLVALNPGVAPRAVTSQAFSLGELVPEIRRAEALRFLRAGFQLTNATELANYRHHHPMAPL